MEPRLIVATSGRTHVWTGAMGLVLTLGLALGGAPWPEWGVAAGSAMILGSIWGVAIGVIAVRRVDRRAPESPPAFLWKAAPGWGLVLVPAVLLFGNAYGAHIWRSVVAGQFAIKFAACAIPPLVALGSTLRATLRLRAARADAS